MTKLYKKHLSRLRFIWLAIVVFLSVSAFRSLYIQLLRSQNKNIIHTEKVKGPRGVIYDRNGVRLAYDVKLYDLYVNDVGKVNLKKISSFMRDNFDPKYNYDSLLKTSNGYLILKKSVLEEKIKTLEYELKQIKGLHTVSYIGRYYPRKNLASQVIGKYSYSVNANKGLWGIERTLGDIISGKEGELEVNIRSRGSKEKAYTDSEYLELSGENVILTIDSDYQRILEDELVNRLNKTNSESANGIIIDPYSGEILALASIPNFDLNGNGQV